MENLDSHILFRVFFLPVNATLAYTWLVMAILVGGAFLAGRKYRGDLVPSRYALFLESLVEVIVSQIEDIMKRPGTPFLPYLGTLFLFIATCNFFEFVPGYHAPTASLSTTSALALSVFLAVPIYAISERGFWGYFKEFIEPSPVMLPLNILGEFSRTLALAVRLYGNVTGGTVVVGILLGIVPYLVPMVMQVFELLIGFIQAYIFAVLAAVYIASAMAAQEKH